VGQPAPLRKRDQKEIHRASREGSLGKGEKVRDHRYYLAKKKASGNSNSIYRALVFLVGGSSVYERKRGKGLHSGEKD